MFYFRLKSKPKKCPAWDYKTNMAILGCQYCNLHPEICDGDLKRKARKEQVK